MKTFISLPLSALLLTTSLCGRAPAADATANATTTATSATTVEISAFAFAPREITVRPGATVTWTNRDQTAHSVISKDAKFSSPGMDTDDRYSFKFEKDGDYTYICSLHPQMTGIVHVRAP